MKKNIVLLCIIAILALAGCAKQESGEQKPAESLTYTNLSDKASQEEVRKALVNAEISESAIEEFFSHVNEFNEMIENTTLTKEGFETVDTLTPEYDIITMQELLDKKSPEFIGYNCRITSLGLMKGLIEISDPVEIEQNSNLFMDRDSIEKKQLFTDQEKQLFDNLFTEIPTEKTNELDTHLAKFQESWKAKGIKFKESSKIRMISVVFNFDDGNEQPTLFIGHVGILLPLEDGKLLFLEKLTFQEPYQAIKFDDRVQLSDYLMNRYDVAWGQPTARPFILENDQLMEGYRPNPKNQG
ncbi:MAG: DUF4300 family protein [Peptostreptococcaceae bacterium]|nr:DUF4300 family protein [Peptostreptococcaceae bacterium]